MIRLTIKLYNDIYIYSRNVDACIQNQKMNRTCTERIRFNTPIIRRFSEVKSADLGDLIIMVAGLIRLVFTKRLTINCSLAEALKHRIQL